VPELIITAAVLIYSYLDHGQSARISDICLTGFEVPNYFAENLWRTVSSK
jgi:hypothetical protein